MENSNKVKINLGSGNKNLTNYINCDFVKSLDVDKYFDLNKFPYPFSNNFADEILMDDVLDHLQNVVQVLEECHRILKNGGILKINVPYFKSDGAFKDPTHLHYFNEHSMDYFSPNFGYNFYTKARYNIIKSELFCANTRPISKIRDFIPFKKILKHFLFNIYDGIHFELQAIK